MDQIFNIYVFSKPLQFEKMMRFFHHNLSGCEVIFFQNKESLISKMEHKVPDLFIGELILNGISFFEITESIKIKNEHCACILIDDYFKKNFSEVKLPKLNITDCFKLSNIKGIFMAILKERAHKIGDKYRIKNNDILNAKFNMFRSPTGLVLTDDQGKVAWMNYGFELISGYHRKKMIGEKPGKILQGPLTNPRTVQSIRNKLKKNNSIDCTIVNYHASGYPYWIQLKIQPFIVENERLMYIAIQSDITEYMPQLI